MRRIKIACVQTFALTVASLKSRYRKTIAGFIWVVLSPLIMYGVQSMVFKKFLNLQIPNFYIFLASGLLPWIFIVQSVQMCTPLFFNNRSILKTYQLNPMVVLLSQLLDNSVNFFFALCILLGPLYFIYLDFSWGILLLPFTFVVFSFGVFSLTWLLSVMNIFFRDTKFIVDFVASIAFWLTPIFYSVENIPERYRWIVAINPANYLIQFFRSNIIDFNIDKYLSALTSVLIVNTILFALAFGYWKIKKDRFYFRL